MLCSRYYAGIDTGPGPHDFKRRQANEGAQTMCIVKDSTLKIGIICCWRTQDGYLFSLGEIMECFLEEAMSEQKNEQKSDYIKWLNTCPTVNPETCNMLIIYVSMKTVVLHSPYEDICGLTFM